MRINILFRFHIFFKIKCIRTTYNGTYKSRMWNKVVEPEAIADANTTQWARTRRWVFRPTIERGREREWIEVKNKRKGFQLRLAYISNDSENKMHTSWCNVALDLDCLPDTLLHANCWYTFGSLDISRKNNFWANFVLFVRCRCVCVLFSFSFQFTRRFSIYIRVLRLIFLYFISILRSCVCIAWGKSRIAMSLNYANVFLHMVAM